MAQPAGSLDPTFGNGGKVVTSLTSGQDKAFGVAIQSDGKIVVAGHSTSSLTGKDFAVIRYNEDGTLDNSFGSNGIVTSDLQTGSEDVAYSVAIQVDGKIVLAGYSDNGSNKDAALIRYLPDGSLDNSFGNNGIVLTDFENLQQDEIKVIKINPLTGKIVVGGSSVISTSIGKPILACYSSDGTLDLTFNSTGIKPLWIATNDNNRIFSVEDLVLESSGKISCVGWRKQVSASISIEYWAARVLSNGNMDLTFSTDGVLQYSEGSGSSSGYGLLLNSTQNIILCGTRQYLGNNSFRTLAINQDGTIPAVSVSYTGYNSGYNIANKIALENNGKYVFAGTSGSSSSNTSFTIARINTNLSSDAGFGTTGFTSTTFGNATNECYNLAIQPDNKIVAVGLTGNDIAIARYLGNVTPELNNFQLILPADLAINQNYTNVLFDWSDAFGAVSYEIQIDVSPTFSSAQTFTSALSQFNASNLQANTQYYWKVRATDGSSFGNYSGAWSFTTNALENFSLISPVNNATNQVYTSLVLDWSDNMGASNYELQIDTTQNFSSNPMIFTTANSTYTTTLLPSKTYYWKVRAANGSTWGQYSATWSFTTNALENFSLISPVNNATNQVYTSLVLDWSDNMGASNYELQIDTTQNFSSNPMVFTTANSTYTTTLLPTKTYYWKVRAANGSTWGQYSTPWSFTTKAASSAGMLEQQLEDLVIYPNPATDQLTLDYNLLTSSELALVITGVTGQIMYKTSVSETAGSHTLSVNTAWFEGGVYYLFLTSNGNTLTRKFIKK